MNEFDACQLYMALKLHFTTKYDYFKYNGKTKLTVPQFNKRKDKYQFVRLARKYSHEELVEYFCANLTIDVKGDSKIIPAKLWSLAKSIATAVPKDSPYKIIFLSGILFKFKKYFAALESL